MKLLKISLILLIIISCGKSGKKKKLIGGCTICSCMAFTPDPQNPAICIRSKPSGGVCQHSKGLHINGASQK